MSGIALKSQKSTKLVIGERRKRLRVAPGYASRKGEKLAEDLSKSELIEKYHHKVRIAAYQIAKKFSHSIEVEDLVSMGFIGLMDAADKYDPSRGVKFETYAEYRIRGSIFDELRKQDWVPRSARDRAREIDKAFNDMEFQGAAPHGPRGQSKAGSSTHEVPGTQARYRHFVDGEL